MAPLRVRQKVRRLATQSVIPWAVLWESLWESQSVPCWVQRLGTQTGQMWALQSATWLG